MPSANTDGISEAYMINILYEDSEIIVCEKEAGMLSEYSEASPVSLPKLLASQLKTKPPLTVHRLDKEVGGIIVYAKNQDSAADLSAQITDGKFKKQYIARVKGLLPQRSDRLHDLLFHDKQKNKTYVAKKKRAGVKVALLDYEVLDFDNDVSTLKINLLTGRTHQIRVQLASRSFPILGDKKYGSKYNLKPIRLFSYKLTFSHPTTKNHLSFTLNPSWIEVNESIDNN